MNDTEFFAALISWIKPRYEGLANLLDTRPEKWLDSIREIRDLCEERGIKDEEQIPYVIANLFL